MLDAQLFLPPHRNVRYHSSLARFPVSSLISDSKISKIIILQRTPNNPPYDGPRNIYSQPPRYPCWMLVLSPDSNPCDFSDGVSSQRECSTLTYGQLITTSFQSFQKLCKLYCEISLVPVHTPFHIERFPLLMRLNF
jgi:hypothetical protein